MTATTHAPTAHLIAVYHGYTRPTAATAARFAGLIEGQGTDPLDVRSWYTDAAAGRVNYLLPEGGWSWMPW